MYSRKIAKERQTNIKKSIYLIIFSILFLLFFVFFGLNFLVKITSFVYDLKKSTIPVDSNDTTPPSPPTFNSLPPFTKDQQLEISGYSEPSSNLTLRLNGESKVVVVSKDGTFSYSFSLKEGENNVSAFSTDQSGNKSQTTITYNVVYDLTPPNLEINSPQINSSFYGSKQKTVNIQGVTEESCEVLINGRHVILNQNSAFSFPYNLSEGDNLLNITAQDKAGNKTEKSITLIYHP